MAMGREARDAAIAWFGELWRRLLFLFRGREFDRDIEDEMRLHVELRAQEHGASAARRRFGNQTLLREVSKEMWGWGSVERLIRDLRYAARMLRRSPGFTTVAILSLALGIGANTAIFSLVNAVMLRSLPVRAPRELVLFGKGEWVGIIDDFPNRSWQLFSYRFYREARRRNPVFADLAAVFSMPSGLHITMQGSTRSEPVTARLVSASYFSTLGVNALQGRVFSASEEDPPGAHPVAVVSYSWWRKRFGGDASAIGKTFAVGPTVFTIAGVTPPEFFGTEVGESPDLWIPLSMQERIPPFPKSLDDTLWQSLYLIGRLKPGVSAPRANAAINVLFHQIVLGYEGRKPSARELEDLRHARIELTPAGRGLSQLRIQFSKPLEALMALVGLVLLIACANIANLLLARSTARQREIAVRLAIGAGRVRLVRQLLTESVLLAFVGGAAGAALAWWGTAVLLRMVAAGGDPIPLNVAPDPAVLGFTLALSVLTGVLFGVAPALRATRQDLSSSLREVRTITGAHASNMLGKALVVAQVALSVVLVVACGLFARSLLKLQSVDTGFDKQNVLLFQMDTDAMGYKEDDPRLAALYEQIENRVDALPGIRASSFSMFAFHEGGWFGPASAEGITLSDKDSEIQNNRVGPGYFAAMEIPVLLGRVFGLRDTPKSRKVAIINETMSRRFFGGQPPLGRHFGLGGPEHAGEIEIVGVVKDAKYESLGEKPMAMAYHPYAQSSAYLGDFLVRATGDPRAAIPEVRRAILAVDPDLPISRMTTLEDQIGLSLARPSLLARLSIFFGALALLLAALGIYGTLSYTVARRTNEIGIRMALGAPRNRVAWMVLRDVLALAGSGLAIGILLAEAAGRSLSSLLYGLTASDPLTMLGAAAVLAVVALMAGYLPARRASRVDPMLALRHE